MEKSKGDSHGVCRERAQDCTQSVRAEVPAEVSTLLRLQWEETRSTEFRAHRSLEGWGPAMWASLFRINYHLCLASYHLAGLTTPAM